MDRNNSLAEITHRYLQLIQAIPAAFYVCDKDGYIIHYNDAAAQLWGRKPVLGEERLCGSWRIYDTAGQPLPLNECPMAISLREGRPIYDAEIIIERPDGVRRHVLPHPRPVMGPSGEIIEIINMLVDITDLKQVTSALKESEERFRTMADQAPVMIWMTDENGQVTYVNTSWSSFTGLPPHAAFGSEWQQLVHPDDRTGVYNKWMRTVPVQQRFYLKFRFLTADQGYATVTGSGNPRYNSNGKFVGYIGILQDVTQQDHATGLLEQEVRDRIKDLRRANRELARSNSELEQFAYVSSHDLQEPLRKIQTYAEILEDRLEISDQAKYYLGKISDSSRRMMAMIRELLQFSRLSQSGEIYEPVHLEDILAQVRNDLELPIQEKHATIEAGPLPVIQGIPLQIKQLFYNLLNNSLKFCREGVPPVIQIRYETLSSAELKSRPSLHPGLHYFKLSFQDNCIGFDQVYADRIFTIFQRLNDRQQYDGNGIGLALCKKIVLNHHGDIYATAAKDSGSTFYVILPETITS
ncbi:PAS domain S-box protein [Chitinophaga pendula]|uniref:PAS domain S-box protein n=1 Tax=Chitinophaga TaxID=79328 RepID=UPI0018DF1E20|nr:MULTISPECIES: PAS domain S-box protein [Chitinophaga]UCJ05870.1 PAS domain S-box protein [Chitinophaga pendula]